MSENWIVQNLTEAFNVWNDKFEDMWELLTVPPQQFKGGKIWSTVSEIHGSLQAVALALLVLFFLFGMVKTCTSWEDVKRPGVALKLFLRFLIAKTLITYSLDIIVGIIDVFRGIINNIFIKLIYNPQYTAYLPDEIVNGIENCDLVDSAPLWVVSLLGSLFIWVLSIILIVTIYKRFFKLFVFTAIAPIPLSTFAGESTQRIGITYLKNFAGVCMEGVVILICCAIFTSYASSPALSTELSIIPKIWGYVGEVVFNMVVLVGSIKISDRMVKEITG